MNAIRARELAKGNMSGAPGWSAFAFFMALYLTGNLLLLNLLSALVIEVYLLQHGRIKEEIASEERRTVLTADDDPSAGVTPLPPSRVQGPTSLHARLATVLTGRMREVFATYDSAGDGVVSIAEARGLVAELNGGVAFASREFAAMVVDLDDEGTGFIDFRELRDWWQHRCLRQAFEAHDVDETGYLDSDELQSLLRSVGVELSGAELLRALEAMDPNADGVVSLEEFVSWWKSYDVDVVFDSADVNRDGFLSVDELPPALARMGVRATRKEARAAMRQLDAVSNRGVSRRDFAAVVRIMRRRRTAAAQLHLHADGQRWEEALFLGRRGRPAELAVLRQAVRREAQRVELQHPALATRLTRRLDGAMDEALALWGSQHAAASMQLLTDASQLHRLADEIERAAARGEDAASVVRRLNTSDRPASAGREARPSSASRERGGWAVLWRRAARSRAG